MIWPVVAAAQPYDPALHFQTLKTPHLRLHYHDGYEAFARDVAKAGEAALAVIQEMLGWQVSDVIEVVLSDDTDDANGDATTLPYPLVHLYATAPDDLGFLSEYHDWVFELIGHELTHIVHLDTISGLPWLVNQILGRTLAPNQVQSRWFIEGLAVEVETRISHGGRARSKMVDMLLRTEALAGDEMRLDQAVNGPLRWPQGSAYYLHGGRFLTWLAQKYGQGVLKDISHGFSRKLIGYAMNRTVKQVTGRDYDDLWGEFLDELKKGYAEDAERVMARGLREGRALTSDGQYKYSPRYFADGRILYFIEGAERLASARVWDPRAGRDHEVRQISSQGSAARPGGDGRAIIAQNEITRHFYSFVDLYALDTTGGGLTRLTHGLRAREPDLAPAGDAVYFVQNQGTRTRLMRAPITRAGGEVKLGAPEIVWDPPMHWQIYTPRVSPKGDAVAVSVARSAASGSSVSISSGTRDIVLVDLVHRAAPDAARYQPKTPTPALRFITDDAPLDGGPCFSPAGDALYFHSARGRIYNIFVYDLARGTLRQVTNTLTGAFSPDISADGRRMAYLTYSTRGFDLAEMTLDPQRFFNDEPAPGREDESAPERREDEPARRGGGDYSITPYAPWRTLLPRAWMPYLDADALGTVVGVVVGAEDPLSRHRYAAEVGYGVTSNDINYNLGYVNHQLYPEIFVQTARRLQSAPTPAVIDAKTQVVLERAHGASIDLSFPLNFALYRFQWTAGYHFEHRQRITEYDFLPDGPSPTLPAEGNFADLSVGFSFSRTRRALGAVSPEFGQQLSVSAQMRDRWTGSDYRQAQVQTTLAHYQLMPYLSHHVLALKVSGGGAYNELTNRPIYSLGGLPVRDIVRDVIFGTLYGDSSLRGYGPAAATGNYFWTASAEYRAPLWRIERGYSVLPFYVRTLSAAAFVDVGNAADPAGLFKRAGVGVGAELRLNLDYGFFYGSTVRIGYARGLTRGGIHNFFLVLSNGF